MSKQWDAISLEIMWGRLIAAVDEMALALERTSFSTAVREANDYACAIFDLEGNSIAENTLGVPSFVGVLSKTMKAFLSQYPKEQWKPGDVGMTNDPWLAMGHLPDVACVAPIFHKGKLVAFCGSVAHKADIGGAVYSADCREIYEEGILFPLCKIVKEGVWNEDILNILRRNVRVPEPVLGDLYAQILVGEVCEQRLSEFLDDSGLDNLDELSNIIQQKAEQAMRKAISELQDGEYEYELKTDGSGEPLTLKVTIRIRGDEIIVDYTGTSPQVPIGLNSVYNYTYAHTAYPLKCSLDPETPKNEGSYKPITMIAPEGCILNPKYPAAVNGRQLTGHYLSAVLYGALSQALPNRVVADSGSGPSLRPVFAGFDHNGGRYSLLLFANGGMGARPSLDGLACTAFPTNAGCTSVEVTESLAQLRFWEKSMIADSGGAGKYRGGLGQRLVIENLSGDATTLSMIADRVQHPALGMAGGSPGAPTRLTRNNETLAPKKRTALELGDVVVIEYPGGGGYGNPLERSHHLVERDLKYGYVSEKAARELYGHQGAGRSATQ